jgi:ketosteroid isomerase-like protein
MEEGRRSTTFAAALAEGDAVAAAAHYADDGKLLTPDADLICGRGDIEAYWREGIAFGLSRLELHETDVQVVGELAIEIGRYVLAVDDACERGKYLVLHRREADGAWRRAVDVYNPEGER